MKILQINAVGQFGSTGRLCTDLQKYINEKTGDECYNAFAVGNAGRYDFLIGDKADHKLHALLARITGRQAFFSKRSTNKLISFIGSIKPDIVHLHNLHSNYIHLPSLMRYLSKHDVATVITLHDCWFYTGGCCHYTAEKCYKWQKECMDCPRWKQDKSWFFDRTKKNFKDKKELFCSVPRLAVAGVSDWITDEAKKSFLSGAVITRRIFNWIDSDVFSLEKNRPDEIKKAAEQNKKTVLGVSSFWHESKGVNEFFELAKTLGDGYIIILIGKAVTNLTDVPRNVIMPGAIGNADKLAEYYAAADVFVTLSRCESFGLVSAEALSCGTPVVCYDSTANKELIGEGCGKAVPAGDLSSVAEAVKEICDVGKEAYSNKCRKFAEKEFDKETQIKKYTALYADLLK